MPCSDSNWHYAHEDWKVQKQRADHLARMLCGICGRLESVGAELLITEDSALTEWWRAHKEFDTQRGELPDDPDEDK